MSKHQQNSYRNYFSALASYEEGTNRLAEAAQPKMSTVEELMKKSRQTGIPVQGDRELLEHLADPENRVPSQLYAVIGEILRLIKKIEE